MLHYHMKDQDRKKVIVLLRWTSIIVTSYLVLLSKGKVTDLSLSYLLIIGYIASNLLLMFLPTSWFLSPKLFYTIVLVDTGIVSFGMYLSERMASDFYFVFFLIIIFASISRNFKLLMTMGGITALVYGVLLYSWGLLTSENSSSYILRIPFIFIMTAFYGYIVQTFMIEKRQQLTISEDKYQGLFENANDGIIILRNSDLEIADANREAERLTGYKKRELSQRLISDLFAQEEREKATTYFDETVKRGEGWTDSLSFMRRDGASVQVELSIKKINLGEDTFWQMILRDLTDQRKFEKKIRESKRNLEAIFDGIQDQLSLQTPDFKILRVNKTVSTKYRLPFQELIGRKCYEAYYERDLPCEKCPMKTTLKTLQPASSIMRIKEPDATTLRIFSYPILDDRGRLLSVIENTQDITEEQRLQEQLIQSEKLVGIGILASGIAHEINNPLSGIIGMTEIALEEDDSSKIKGYLADVLNCAERIGEITKGLRSYSRIAKDGEQTLIDINEVLEGSVKMVHMAMKLSPVEVIQKFQALEKIGANPGEVQQVFTNLITNAFQAMSGKGGKLILSTRSLKDWVEVQVADTGVGIPEKYVKKVFDPFFTTKNPGEGTGLGLNIVYRIVTKYGGSIDVQSKEMVGTTFTVKFPIRRGVDHEEKSFGG